MRLLNRFRWIIYWIGCVRRTVIIIVVLQVGGMSLRKRTFLIVGITLAAMICILFMASQVILRYGVETTESNTCLKCIDRAGIAFEGILADLDLLAYDWSAWDDTYQFMDDMNEGYTESNLANSTFTTTPLDLVLYVDVESNLFFGSGYDHDKEEFTPVPQSIIDELQPGSPFLTLDEESGTSGLLVLPEGNLLLAARTILTSDEEGPAHGTLIMARYLSDEMIEHLSQVSQLAIEISGTADSITPPDFLEAAQHLTPDDPVYISHLSGESIAGYTILEDLYGNPALILKAEMPRTAYIQAQTNRENFAWLILAVGLVFGTVTLLILERLVLSRMSKLSRQVNRIGETRDLSEEVYVSGDDELSSLASVINSSLQELKRSESKLLAKTEQLQTLIENQGEGVIIIDNDETFTFANPAADEIYGVEKGTLVGKKLSDFVTPEILEMIRKERSGSGTGSKRSYEFEINIPSGEIRYLLETTTPKFDDDGNLVGTFVVLRDVTDIKHTDQLRAKLEVKSDFLSMVSHELRSPLVPIMGYTELVLSGKYCDLPEELSEPLGIVYKRAVALKRLIDDILQLNQIEHGKLDIDLESINLKETLESVIKPYQDVNRDKPITINVVADDFNVMSDHERLQQVIQNLIENSIKYSSETVNILVKAEKIDDEGVITIKDNGIGILPEYLPVIFERFYQIERPNTRKHGGAGLGLAISRELIELMGGSIAVESEIDVGTTFIITLKTTDAILPETFLREHGQAGDPDADMIDIPDHSPSERILVVDDDPFSSALLEKILDQDFFITTAASGSEGLDMILNESFDLILLDWMMPGMDGLSLLIAIKNIEEYRDIPVIFVSGKAEPESMEEALKAGAAAFIAKPFSRAKLMAQVHRALGYESHVT